MSWYQHEVPGSCNTTVYLSHVFIVVSCNTIPDSDAFMVIDILICCVIFVSFTIFIWLLSILFLFGIFFLFSFSLSFPIFFNIIIVAVAVKWCFLIVLFAVWRVLVFVLVYYCDSCALLISWVFLFIFGCFPFASRSSTLRITFSFIGSSVHMCE